MVSSLRKRSAKADSNNSTEARNLQPPGAIPVDAAYSPLVFVDDPKAHRATWIAVFLLLAVLVWMGSGFVFSNKLASLETPAKDQPLTKVVVEKSLARSVPLAFTASAESKANQEVWIVPRVAGEIIDAPVERGDDVVRGQVIARIDDGTQQAGLAEALADLANAQREMDNASKLLKRGVVTEDRVESARANLAAAKATVAEAEEDLADTIVSAPFSGRLEELNIVKGQFVQQNEQLAQIVDLAHLKVSFRVPQDTVANLQVGSDVTVEVPGRTNRVGTLTFVGQRAHETTRTFSAEATIVNDTDPIPAGISLQLKVPTGEVSAHFVSPALLSMNAEGDLGIMVIKSGNVVAFQPVDIVQAQTDGVWVSGLNDETGIITIGQSFVSAGQKVDIQLQETAVSHSQLAPNTVGDAL